MKLLLCLDTETLTKLHRPCLNTIETKLHRPCLNTIETLCMLHVPWRYRSHKPNIPLLWWEGDVCFSEWPLFMQKRWCFLEGVNALSYWWASYLISRSQNWGKVVPFRPESSTYNITCRRESLQILTFQMGKFFLLPIACSDCLIIVTFPSLLHISNVY